TRSPETIYKDVRDCLKECKAEAIKSPASFASFQPASESATYSALIISNDDAIDSMLSDYASKKDAELTRCSMETAEEQFKKKHFDLLFVDPADEQDKVWQLIQIFRSERKNQQVPIALIKGDASNTCTEEIFHGIDFSLNRPLSSQTM